MARKVFISILGTGFYSECKYVTSDFKSTNTRFAQEALLDFYNTQEWEENDIALFFLTDTARKTNWDINERKHNQQGLVEYKGLKYIMDEMNLPIQIVDKYIPDGKNETEMWEIFTTIFNQLNKDDELYIDLTHSFRYLPMLLLVLSNYAKFLKNIKVVNLSYGNFEARNQETNEAPIINLLPITALQDWTFAAADYLKNGNVDRLSDLSYDTLTPILRDSKGKDKAASDLRDMINTIKSTTEDFQTCRGMNIINATNIAKLKKLLQKIELTYIEPLNPLVNKFVEVFDKFDAESNIKNGFEAANWCFNHGLYQQAATILQENVVSYFCLKYNIRIDNDNEREIINQAFGILGNGIENDETRWIVKEEYRDKVRDVLKDEELNMPEILKTFSRLTELRNDINHSGMRSSKAPLRSSKIRSVLESDIKILSEALLSKSLGTN